LSDQDVKEIKAAIGKLVTRDECRDRMSTMERVQSAQTGKLEAIHTDVIQAKTSLAEHKAYHRGGENATGETRAIMGTRARVIALIITAVVVIVGAVWSVFMLTRPDPQVQAQVTAEAVKQAISEAITEADP
jgi:t-SNARE complex subunit (syntaxin)